MISEKERQRVLEKQRKEARKKERQELRDEKHRVEAALGQTSDADVDVQDSQDAAEETTTARLIAQHRETPRVAHAQAHDIGHGEPVSIKS